MKQYGSSAPLTLTGFQMSRSSNVFTSGLAFDISGLAHDDDQAKQALFIDNPIFEFYLNVAKQYGFSISKNVPWVIVADLSSPAMKAYLEPLGLSTARSVFTTRYRKTVELDISFLRELIFTYYNDFVNSKPYSKTITTCNGKSKSTIRRRSTLIRSEMNNIINNNIIIDLYNSIRNNEEGSPYGTAESNLINKNAKKIKDSLDMDSAISYIEEQYRSIRKFKPGGLNSVIKKQNQKELKEKFGAQDPNGGGY
jgi:hypothetical protein